MRIPVSKYAFWLMQKRILASANTHSGAQMRIPAYQMRILTNQNTHSRQKLILSGMRILFLTVPEDRLQFGAVGGDHLLFLTRGLDDYGDLVVV